MNTKITMELNETAIDAYNRYVTYVCDFLGKAVIPPKDDSAPVVEFETKIGKFSFDDEGHKLVVDLNDKPIVWFFDKLKDYSNLMANKATSEDYAAWYDSCVRQAFVAMLPVE